RRDHSTSQSLIFWATHLSWVIRRRWAELKAFRRFVQQNRLRLVDPVPLPDYFPCSPAAVRARAASLSPGELPSATPRRGPRACPVPLETQLTSRVRRCRGCGKRESCPAACGQHSPERSDPVSREKSGIRPTKVAAFARWSDPR